MERKIGLLLPRSVIYPSMGFDIVGGLRGALAEAGMNDVVIKTENIGIASDDKLSYSACEKLIFDGCSVVAGYVNPSAAEKLQVLCEGANVVFLHLDAGYQYPASAKMQPHLFTLSLQGALNCRVASAAAVAEGVKGAAFTASFFDAGFRGVHGFHRGLEDAGGYITFNHITKLKRAEFSLEPLIEHLAANPDDGLLAAFCGDMLQDFFAGLAAYDLSGRKVYGSSFMGDEVWLAQSVYPGVDVRVCVSWAGTLEHEGNKRFMRAMAEKKVKTNFFSVLGWEAGQMMAVILRHEDAAEAIAALEGLEFESPRGHVRVNAVTHMVEAPVYDALVKKNEFNDRCVLHVVGLSPLSEEQRKKQEEVVKNFDGMATSWMNAYACLDS